MRLNKSLLAGVAAAALFAAVPASALQPLPRPEGPSLMLHVQASAADAEAALNDAIAKLEAAKVEGADTSQLEAAVEAAKANLAAAREAEAGAAKAAEEAAAAKAAEDAAAAKAAEEAAAAKAAEEAAAAKAAEDAAAAKAAEEAAAAKGAEDAAAAKAAEDAAAAKAAEDAAAAKAAEDAAAAKAAEDAAAAKAAEEAAAKAAADAEAAKAAGDAEAIKAAEEAAAKAAQDAEAAKAASDAAAKAAEEAAAAKAAEDAAAAAKAAEPAPADPAAPAPVEPAATPAEPAPAPVLEQLPEAQMQDAAPMLDSAKEVLAPPPPPAEGQPALPAPAPVDPALATAPPPTDDNNAREALESIVIQAITQETGERINEFPPAPPPPPQEEVVKVIDNRTIFTINNITYVEAPETQRLVRQDDEVIIERLPRQRTRETIVRENGVQVVTIKNRWGDVIQRSRILPDGREVILAYTPENDREEYVEWRDPVYDLPPLRLRIDVRDYTLDARTVEEDDDEEVYYRFLEQPPVERVERVYSVLDVKRSARVRDKARRIEMGNITFGFGTADIEEDQIDKLQGMADAMQKLIKKNPAETFLIEGHTDAVGSENANLALSDKRAESVAIALANVFDVPSENLTTQGYGERYLKVKTDTKEPLNRRVVFRRITPLVTPVASAQ